jgi:hypothetical protein
VDYPVPFLDGEDSDLGPECRICGGEVSSPGNLLVSPCKCTGGMEHVHTDCLNRWMTLRPAKYRNGVPLPRDVCEVCGVKYAAEGLAPPPPLPRLTAEQILFGVGLDRQPPQRDDVCWIIIKFCMFGFVGLLVGIPIFFTQYFPYKDIFDSSAVDDFREMTCNITSVTHYDVKKCISQCTRKEKDRVYECAAFVQYTLRPNKLFPFPEVNKTWTNTSEWEWMVEDYDDDDDGDDNGDNGDNDGDNHRTMEEYREGVVDYAIYFDESHSQDERQGLRGLKKKVDMNDVLRQNREKKNVSDHYFDDIFLTFVPCGSFPEKDVVHEFEDHTMQYIHTSIKDIHISEVNDTVACWGSMIDPQPSWYGCECEGIASDFVYRKKQDPKRDVQHVKCTQHEGSCLVVQDPSVMLSFAKQFIVGSMDVALSFMLVGGGLMLIGTLSALARGDLAEDTAWQNRIRIAPEPRTVGDLLGAEESAAAATQAAVTPAPAPAPAPALQ